MKERVDCVKAFDHDIYFDQKMDLGIVDDENLSETKKITVKQLTDKSQALSLKIRSNWFDVSEQKARYLSTVPFEKASGDFLWALEIKSVMTLFWDAGKREVLYFKDMHYSFERLQFWVLHTFLPLAFELERRYRILHVGSVEVAGKAICFSAFSYGGKSTLTDYFLKQGHPLLSDDSLGIEKRDDGYYAVPSYPFHRPYREVETLGYHTKNFAKEPKILHALYALEKSDPDAEVQIEELRGIEKFKAFHYSSFVDFGFMKRERFDFFSQMAKEVPAYSVVVPWDKTRLGEVYDAIVKHSQEI
ncbi:MAG: hypothetical protein L3J47_00825 [Sulfurovum sp.]|nr:hypothetical protein [Sulfurovum sp.]